MSGHVVSGAMTFDPRNITSKANRTKVEPGLPCGTLHDTAQCVAMTLNAENGERYDAESETFVCGADCYNGQITGDVSATLGTPGSSVSASGPTLVYRQGVRRLMPIECERLQGFPDNWTAGFSDSARYRMLGNAVSVPVIEWIAKRILHYSK